jgi:predicted DNA-binding protein YlxM (UPF0122 family)
MGSKKSSKPKAVVAPDTTALQQQYQQSLQAIQSQSQDALGTIAKANEASVQALNQQLTQSQQTNQAYEQQLNTYLQQLSQTQVEQQKALAERDKSVATQQTLEKQELEGASLSNRILAANQIANSQFSQRTSRKRGFIV